MQWNDPGVARHVVVRELGRTSVIQVDGTLDLIGGYDLRQAFAAALQSATEAVTMDFSSVTAVEEPGLASLEWCLAQAIEARRVLSWTSCSQPFPSVT